MIIEKEEIIVDYMQFSTKRLKAKYFESLFIRDDLIKRKKKARLSFFIIIIDHETANFNYIKHPLL